MAEKTYVGNGKVKETEYGNLISFKLGPNDIKTINEWADKHQGWCTVTIFQRKEPSEKGTTHYGVLDTWEPNQNKGEANSDKPNSKPTAPATSGAIAGIQEAYPNANKEDDDKLPF